MEKHGRASPLTLHSSLNRVTINLLGKLTLRSSAVGMTVVRRIRWNVRMDMMMRVRLIRDMGGGNAFVDRSRSVYFVDGGPCRMSFSPLRMMFFDPSRVVVYPPLTILPMMIAVVSPLFSPGRM